MHKHWLLNKLQFEAYNGHVEDYSELFTSLFDKPRISVASVCAAWLNIVWVKLNT